MKMCMVAIFILGMTALSEGTDICPAGWRYFGRNCYLIVNDLLTWKDARNDCVKRGGQLAVVNNRRLNNFLKEQAYYSGTAKWWWIGLSDERNEGIFRWEGTGQRPRFVDWNTGEPNNHGEEDCIQMNKDMRYRWNDAPCRNRYGYICQQRIAGACRHRKCC